MICLLAVEILLQTPCIQAQQNADFEGEVAPILIRRCLECHQESGKSGEFALDSAIGLMKGGESGAVIDRKSAMDSLLLQRVAAGEMPPPKHGESQKIPAAEIQILKRWIDAGAEFPKNRRLDLYEQTTDVRGGRDWWSFQPLSMAEPPQVASLPVNANPIDRFIVSRLAEHGLTAAPPASPEIIARRLYWDVTGLPATFKDLERLSREPDQQLALDRLVDSLLDSPQFGERWARHWLDVVRFAETCGYERDQVKPFAWKYRDWVVRAFNSDMPYDQFVREQLAGDEIPDRSEQSVIATGFLCLGTWNDEPNDAEDYKYERLEDLVHTTSSAFLGMTTKCARCHDHKFDPIPQTDYYRMAAAFWPGPIQPRGRELIGGNTTEELGFRDVLGWTDVTRTPSPLHKLKNGERHHPLELVTAAPLSCVPGEFREFTPAPESSRTTGLRLQLADWIASPHNPLTARVIVNRLWQHHFGEGIVRSSINFGFTGERPTHPELLDWLAMELVRNNWNLKSVHRLILTSRTWRQSSIHPRQQEYNLVDSANRFLWRAHRRRKDAESLRDAFLVSSGELNLALGGPSFYPTISSDALEGLSRKAAAWNASPKSEQLRRSLYIFTQRSLLPPLMTTFDMCDSTTSCGQRDVTVVAPQALTLLNNEFVHDRAKSLVARLVTPEMLNSDEPVTESAVSREAIIGIWKSILNRQPSSDELEISLRHVSRQKFRFAAESASTTEQSADNSVDLTTLVSTATLALDASTGVVANADGLVEVWRNKNGSEHDATQPKFNHRPGLIPNIINGWPVVRFDGDEDFMHLQGALLQDDEVTVVAVVTDAAPTGHRELLSNWSGRDGNSVTSFFVGMTNDNAVRLSDTLSGVGEIGNRQQPFLLTATNGAAGAAIFQQKRPVIERTERLPKRRLDTPWVIGQQGNINGEYWKGDVACLFVFNRQLTNAEQESLQDMLIAKYSLAPLDEPSEQRSTDLELALASLCVVLFNSNEFAYVD